MSPKLDILAELAKEDRKRQFFSTAHLITPEALYAAFRGLRKQANAGVDGVRYEEYQAGVERKIAPAGGRAAEGPQFQAPGPLPARRAPDELSVPSEVLSRHLSTLALLAQSPNAWVAADVASIQCSRTAVSSVPSSDLPPRTEVVSCV